MARRYRRRRHLHFKLKKETVFTIVAVLLMGGAALVGISYFQSGTALIFINGLVGEKFGWGGILLPIVLLSLSTLFLGIKTSFTKPNVPLGLLLTYITLLALTQSGFIGLKIWNNFATLVSGFGAFVLLLGTFFIGLIVLFNTSIDEIITGFSQLSSDFLGMLKNIPIFSFLQSKSKPLFVEKLSLKTSGDMKKDEKVDAGSKNIPEKKTPASLSEQTKELISANLISNTSASTVWEYPPLSLLTDSAGQKADRGDLKQNAHIIEKTLESFGVTARVAEVNLGPAVTQYALEIAMGTKLSKLTALSNDLALALAAPTGQIRIEAPIPGRSLVGIEIPNRSLEFVTLRHMLFSDTMRKSKDKLLVALGLDVSGSPVTANIAKMPHVLIAGTTGSGKSVLLNTWICSLLFRTTPSEVRLILVDPKRVELTVYNSIPHLLTPVIVEPDKILSALKWSLSEMDRRYKLFSEVGVRNIDGYNELSGFQALPYIVILVDELADLMAYAPVEVEDAICRLAQMARATGLHLVVSTQRPSVDVITGLLKANIPARIAFNVSSMIDSRVIIDMPGAEKLLGRGDMLFIPPDQAKPTRIQGAYISEAEVGRLVDFLKSKNIPVQYTTEVTSMPQTWKKSGGSGISQTIDSGRDNQFEEAVRVVCQYDRASASLLQRRLSIGYARAARILDQLEEAGIVGPGEGSKPRDVLVRNAEEFLAQQNQPAETSPQN
ncbi:DNA translocase FtsK [Candidatus Gottesmanbacteria bacterium]|nr:DNA translocase FtsK [Candidatus Gottesmanbacteria bacterium]